jgi:hypothetical protein
MKYYSGTKKMSITKIKNGESELMVWLCYELDNKRSLWYKGIKHPINGKTLCKFRT